VICRGRPQGRDDVCHVEEVMLARFPARIIIAAFVEVIHALVPLKLDPAIFANVIGIQRAGEARSHRCDCAEQRSYYA
jgi:hypothetical protein